MSTLAIILVTSLFAYVTATSLDCPRELKNCSCYGNTFSCNEHGYQSLPESTVFDLGLLYFYFDQNNLTVINDRHFENFVRLTHLSMRENKIASISENAFHKNPNLITIDLSHNHLSYLPTKLFQRLDFLQDIYLSFNKLKRIETDHFTHLMTLEEVRLNNNELSYVGKDAFINSSGITKLYLEFNRLEIPEKNWLVHFDHKNIGEYEVYMDDNLWSCDCRMRDFVEWGKSNPWFLLHDRNGVSVPECREPVALKGISLARISSINDLKCSGVNITSHTRTVKVIESHKVTLFCEGTGFPQPTVSIVDPNGKKMTSARGSISYTFEKPKVSDSGSYLCNVSGYKFDDRVEAIYQAASINLDIYRTPADVATIVIVSLFFIGSGLAALVWTYKKKCGSKSSYGRLPNNSAYYDTSSVTASARHNARSIQTPLGGPSAPTSVVNPYQGRDESADDYDDDVITEYSKDTEFLV